MGAAEGPWIRIRLDLIVGLLKTKDGFDAILVIIDYFTKMAHFVVINEQVN